VHRDIKVENICITPPLPECHVENDAGSLDASPDPAGAGVGAVYLAASMGSLQYKLVDFGCSVHVHRAQGTELDDAFSRFLFLRPTKNPPVATILAHTPDVDAAARYLLADCSSESPSNDTNCGNAVAAVAAPEPDIRKHLDRALHRFSRVREALFYDMGIVRAPGNFLDISLHVLRVHLMRIMNRWEGVCGSVKGALVMAGDMYALGVVLNTVLCCFKKGAEYSHIVKPFIKRLITFDFAPDEDVGRAYEAQVLQPLLENGNEKVSKHAFFPAVSPVNGSTHPSRA
jgi:hypothetical protein